MTQWSTSYRWQSLTKSGVDKMRGKVPDKRGAVGASLEHSLRSLDPEQQHSNPNIDRERTKDNEVLLPDGRGGIRIADDSDSSESVEAAVDARVALARHTKTMKNGEVRPVAVRSDATTCLEFVVQLDPEYTGRVVDMTDEQKEDARQKLGVMIGLINDQVGFENFIAAAIHWDEEHVHAHVYVTPLVEEKLVGTKIMGTSAADYAKRHDEMRTALRQVTGYDATFDRVDGGRGHEELKTFKARRDREKKLVAGEAELQKQQAAATAATTDAWDAVRAAQQVVKQREEAVAATETAVQEKLQEAERKLSEAHTEGFRAGSAEAAGMMSELQGLLDKYGDVDRLVSLTKQLATSSNTVWHAAQELEGPTIVQDRRELGDDLHKIEKALGWRIPWKGQPQAPEVERPTIRERLEAAAAQVASNWPETVDDPAR